MPSSGELAQVQGMGVKKNNLPSGLTSFLPQHDFHVRNQLNLSDVL